MKKLFLFTIYCLLFTACQESPLVKPTASGRPYEVLVIMDEEPWKGPVGRALYGVLTSDIVGLPRSESFSSVSQVSVNNFNNALKLFRNIIYVDINPQIYSRTSLHFVRDENANGQYIITIQSPNGKSFIEYCEDRGEELKAFIHRAEIKRMVAKLKKKHSARTADMVKEAFDCELFVPVDLSCYKKGKDFVWTSTPGSQMNICVYSYPYEGPHTFTADYVLGKRDSVMRANIPGSSPDDYMSTDHTMTDVTSITVKGDYCMEARGQWEMTVAFLAGPFVSHSRVDTINNRVIVAEGFVMEFDKLNRTMMRNLEAALWTLNLPAATPQDKAKADSTQVIEE